jgi:hypothetical protein
VPFLKFSGAPMILLRKSVFFAFNVSLRWLNNDSGVYVLSPGFLDSCWSAGFGTFLQVSTLASHWLEDCANVRQRWRKMTNTAPTTPMQYKQHANPLLSMHNYTLLVIGENDKNKQLTLIRQCKLALTAINTLFAL